MLTQSDFPFNFDLIFFGSHAMILIQLSDGKRGPTDFKTKFSLTFVLTQYDYCRKSVESIYQIEIRWKIASCDHTSTLVKT
jgi:hypothetical protein